MLLVEVSSRDEQAELGWAIESCKQSRQVLVGARPLSYLEAGEGFLEPQGWDLAIKQGLANSIQVSAHKSQPPHCLP